MEQFITVKTIYPAGPGKKAGAIIDTNGVRWGVWASDIPNFTQGASYKVWDWQVGTWQGKPTQTIRSDGYQLTAPPQGASQAQPRSQANGGPRPSAPSGGFDDHTRRRDIFVCGALNNLLGNESQAERFFNQSTGQLDGKLLVETVWKLRKVFDYSLGPAAQDPAISTAPVGRQATPEQQAEAAMGYGRVGDMNDEIPFAPEVR